MQAEKWKLGEKQEGLMNQAPTAARAAESPRRRGVGARLPRPYSVLIKAVMEWSVTARDDGMIPPAFGLPPYQGGQGGSHTAWRRVSPPDAANRPSGQET